MQLNQFQRLVTEVLESDGTADALLLSRVDLRKLCVERDIQDIRGDIEVHRSHLLALEVELRKTNILLSALKQLAINKRRAVLQVKVEDGRNEVGEEMGRQAERENTEDDEVYVSDVEASSAVDMAENRQHARARVYNNLRGLLGGDFDL